MLFAFHVLMRAREAWLWLFSWNDWGLGIWDDCWLDDAMPSRFVDLFGLGPGLYWGGSCNARKSYGG